MSAAEFFRSAWSLNLPVLLGCGVLAGAYAWGSRLRFSARSGAWILAVVLILAAVLSPIGVLADRYLFSVHMARHILFVLVVPALLLLGLPAAPVECAFHRGLVPRSAGRLLEKAAFTWCAGVGAMAFWHIPAVFHMACSVPLVHDLEGISLLLGGAVFWWPILSPRLESRLSPVPHGAAYLFSACAACTVMGIVITFAPSLLYPEFARPADPYGMLRLIRGDWGISPALDQQVGGLLMWVPACFVYLTAILAMFARWYAGEPAIRVEA